MSRYSEGQCTVEYEGREFSSNGAEVTDNYLLAYGKFKKEILGEKGEITNWKGDKLGDAWIVGKWRTPNGFISSYQYQYDVLINGIWFTARGLGSGMLCRGRRKKIQTRSRNLKHKNRSVA